MSIAQTHAERTPHDLSHLVFSCGQMGRLQTLSTIPVIAGDSFQQNLIGSFKLSPMRRGLAVDCVMDIFTFYVPHRHIYGLEWINFMKAGIQSTPLQKTHQWGTSDSGKLAHLGVNHPATLPYAVNTPAWLHDGYEKIYNNYFKTPWENDISLSPATMSADNGLYGYSCAKLKKIWTNPLPPERGGRDIQIPIDGEDNGKLNIVNLNQQFGMLHTEQERELFMQRYRDVIGKMGGHVKTDADERPTLLMRSTQWASGYDVDGTDQTTLGQVTGRVQQTFNHKVPRFFVPEHGVMWTVMVPRFPPTHTSEYQFLVKNPNSTYLEIAGDPALVANQQRRVVTKASFFPIVDTAYSYQIPENQWYRYHPDTVHAHYANLQGYPFVDKVPNSDDEAIKTDAAYYDAMFQTTQLGHWNIQAKNNVTCMRALPTARDSLVTSN